MKKILITQSNYIPWKGYFDAINLVDEFVVYDCVQYTKRDWRNRNKIKTRNGTQWLTIPVKVKGKFEQLISETEISRPEWTEKHWNTIAHNYSKAPFFKENKDRVEKAYDSCDYTLLSEINQHFIKSINSILGIKAKITTTDNYSLKEGKNERLISICQQAEATDYYTGPAAQSYINIDKFNEAGINVHFLDYNNYRTYPQLFGNFEHSVSILDLLFNTGKNANDYLKNAPK